MGRPLRRLPSPALPSPSWSDWQGPRRRAEAEEVDRDGPWEWGAWRSWAWDSWQDQESTSGWPSRADIHHAMAVLQDAAWASRRY